MIFNRNDKMLIKKVMKRCIAFALVLALCCSPVFALDAKAADDQDTGSQAGQEVEQQADSWRYSGGQIIEDDENAQMGSQSVDDETLEVQSTGEGLSLESTGKYQMGIDVSCWQGNIDWAAVKASGVDFAIIRCGYGSTGEDSFFESNVKGCISNGIPYGVYLYSYAPTVADASKEAAHTLEILKKVIEDQGLAKPQLPVYYDLEDNTVGSGVADRNTEIRSIAQTYCAAIETARYQAGVYANLNWWNNKIKSAVDGYDKWIAQWNYRCTYGGKVDVWQYTSSASVPGISGRVDGNIMGGKEVPLTPYTADDGYIRCYDENGNAVANRWLWTGNIQYFYDGAGRAYINRSKAKKKVAVYYNPGSSKAGKVKRNKKFYVMRTAGAWSQMDNGLWIKTSSTSKLEIYPNIAPTENAGYVTKMKKKSAVYSGPSTSYVKKKTYKKNKKVTVVGFYGGWAKLSTGYWVPRNKLR